MLILLLIAVAYGDSTENISEITTPAREYGRPKRSETINCTGVIFHSVYFDREILFKDLGKPYNLVMHKFSGTLFFSHTIQNETHVDFGITHCHIDKRKCRNIDGVPGGYAIAYDSGNDDVYFGGHDGIYKYNFLTQQADFFAEKGKSIWGLFVKRHFYYIDYPFQKLYVYQDDMFVKVAESTNIEIDHFFISKHNEVYFSNKTALYKVEKSTKEVLHLTDEIVVRQIVEDGYGDVYFIASDGIYLENKPKLGAEKIAEVDQAFGMTFDENDKVIYSDKDAIYRLQPSRYKELCYDAVKFSVAESKEDEQWGNSRDPLKTYKKKFRTKYF